MPSDSKQENNCIEYQTVSDTETSSMADHETHPPDIHTIIKKIKIKKELFIKFPLTFYKISSSLSYIRSSSRFQIHATT